MTTATPVPPPDSPSASTQASTQAASPGPAPTLSPQALPLGTGHAAIVGLQWGDEGKGQITDILTPRFDAVARYNGGNNAGHSVYIGDTKLALHLVPSGIAHAGKLNVLGNGLVVDPSPDTGILKEIDQLIAGDIDPTGRLFISERAHVVMPYHRVEDALREAAFTQARDGDENLGTTGRGIGPCYADKIHRTTAIRVGDLLHPDRLRERLPQIVPIKNAILAALAQHTGQDFTPVDPDALIETALTWGDRLAPFIGDTAAMLRDAQADGKRVLFEGANATLLDVDHGTYPFVTSSSTCALGIATGVGIPTTQLTDVLGVCKAYTSRVGGGPHPTEQPGEVGQHLQQKGNEFGTTTGRPRRCGWLDLAAVKYAVELNGITGIALTGLAVLAGLPRLRVAVGYRHQARRLDHYPPDAATLATAQVDYEELPGFDQPLGDLRHYADLPAAARQYVQRVENYVGVPVRVVCVGPKRAQALVK